MDSQPKRTPVPVFDPQSELYQRARLRFGLHPFKLTLIVGGIAVLHAQVISMQLDIEEREDQFFFDDVPNYSGKETHISASELQDAGRTEWSKVTDAKAHLVISSPRMSTTGPPETTYYKT